MTFAAGVVTAGCPSVDGCWFWPLVRKQSSKRCQGKIWYQVKILCSDGFQLLFRGSCLAKRVFEEGFELPFRFFGVFGKVCNRDEFCDYVIHIVSESAQRGNIFP